MSGAQPFSSSSSNPPQLEKTFQRAYISCHSCRSLKAKCELPASGGNSCTHCLRRRRECVFPEDRSMKGKKSKAPPRASKVGLSGVKSSPFGLPPPPSGINLPPGRPIPIDRREVETMGLVRIFIRQFSQKSLLTRNYMDWMPMLMRETAIFLTAMDITSNLKTGEESSRGEGFHNVIEGVIGYGPLIDESEGHPNMFETAGAVSALLVGTEWGLALVSPLEKPTLWDIQFTLMNRGWALLGLALNLAHRVGLFEAETTIKNEILKLNYPPSITANAIQNCKLTSTFLCAALDMYSSVMSPSSTPLSPELRKLVRSRIPTTPEFEDLRAFFDLAGIQREAMSVINRLLHTDGVENDAVDEPAYYASASAFNRSLDGWASKYLVQNCSDSDAARSLRPATLLLDYEICRLFINRLGGQLCRRYFAAHKQTEEGLKKISTAKKSEITAPATTCLLRVFESTSSLMKNLNVMAKVESHNSALVPPDTLSIPHRSLVGAFLCISGDLLPTLRTEMMTAADIKRVFPLIKEFTKSVDVVFRCDEELHGMHLQAFEAFTEDLEDLLADMSEVYDPAGHRERKLAEERLFACLAEAGVPLRSDSGRANDNAGKPSSRSVYEVLIKQGLLPGSIDEYEFEDELSSGEDDKKGKGKKKKGKGKGKKKAEKPEEDVVAGSKDSGSKGEGTLDGLASTTTGGAIDPSEMSSLSFDSSMADLTKVPLR